MIESTLFHFSCGHSMNKKADDDVCPLCQYGILTGEQPISIMPEDVRRAVASIRERGDHPLFGKSVLDDPEYKKAQQELNQMYRSMVDTFAGRKGAGSKVTYMPISKDKMEGR
jgi:hypothetical protein